MPLPALPTAPHPDAADELRRAVAAKATDADVIATQVHQVHSRLWVSALGSIGVALAFTVPMLPLFDVAMTLVWLGVVLVVQGLRLGQWALYRRHGVEQRHLLRWQQWFVFGSAAAGASWALGPVLLVGLAPPEARVPASAAALLAAALLAISAVAVAQLSAQLRALAVFLNYALLPLAGVLMMEPEFAVQMLGAVVAMAWVMLMISGRASALANEALIRAELGLSGALAEAQRMAADLQAASEQRHLESQRLSHLLAATNAASAEWNLGTQRVRLNDRGVAMLGLADLPPDGVPMAQLAALVHPDDLPEARLQVRELLSGARPACEFEVRLRHADGRWIWTRAAGRVAARNPGAEAASAAPIATATFIDISEAKANERRWRSRAELSADWFWEADPQHRVTLLSDGIRDGLPIAHSRLIGRRLSEVAELSAVDGGWSVLAAKLGEQQMFSGFVCRLRADNGSVHYIELDGRPRHSENGQFLGYEGVGRDVTARRRATDALKDSLALVDALFDTMAVPVVLKDTSGRYVRMNKAYQDLIALPPGETGATAGHIDEVVDADAAALHAGIDAELLATPGQRRYEVHQRLPSGRWIDALVHKSTLVAADGRNSGLVGTLIDITEQQRAARALAEAKEAAEQANRAKSSFLATMSHELRTPLNAVIGAAQLLRTAQGDEQARRALVETIETSGTNLLGLVENIMDLSRIEAGALAISSEDFNLLECAEAAVATSAVAARAKGLRMACIVEPDVPAWRRGDVLRLRQMLLNLLGNAVKFTLRGEVVLHLSRCAGERADAEALRIAVSDTGVGIPEAALADIFKPFRQADAGTNRRFGGSGLGLAIVHQLVQAMGGRIAVQSQLGHGTRFEVTLPLPLSSATPPAVAALGHAVAFVEPHEASAHALHALLERLGCEALRITEAGALGRWAQAHGRAGWLLMATDVEDAAEFLEAAAPWLEPSRVIGLAEQPNYADTEGRESVGPQSQLAKPVLRARLVSALGAVRGADFAGEAKPSSPLPTPSHGAIGTVLVVEDDATNRQIVSSMLKHAGYAVGLAVNGQQALEHLAQREWGLVLMDWQMPDMDGLEVTRRLRSGERGSRGQRVPIVALTANAFAEDRSACLAAGMNDFLTKPVHMDSLIATVARWCEAGAASQAVSEVGELVPRPTQLPEPHPAAPAPLTSLAPPEPEINQPGVPAVSLESRRVALAAFDPSVLRGLPMVADGSQPEVADELLGDFIALTRQRLAAWHEAASSAPEPLTVWQRHMHTLKSSAAAVGALALADVAADAERRARGGARATPQVLAALHAAFASLTAAIERHGAFSDSKAAGTDEAQGLARATRP